MDYKEFVEKYKKGQVDVMVHKSNSLRTINAGYLPKNYYWAHTLWSWIWFLSIPAGIILLFVNLGIGIFVLFFISFLGGRAIKKSASQFVLQHALENKNFYEFAIDSGTLVIKENTKGV